jgi:CRP/FNR family cyclic AMP-dependent transcriptional regulator
MSPTVARRAAEGDVRIARAFLGELSERVQSFIYEISGSAFTTLRRRVARHLLDLASERGTELSVDPKSAQELIVRVSQQELADAVGTVREVVVRALRELRQAGIVRTERDRICHHRSGPIDSRAGVEPRFLTNPVQRWRLRT